MTFLLFSLWKFRDKKWRMAYLKLQDQCLWSSQRLRSNYFLRSFRPDHARSPTYTTASFYPHSKHLNSCNEDNTINQIVVIVLHVQNRRNVCSECKIVQAANKLKDDSVHKEEEKRKTRVGWTLRKCYRYARLSQDLTFEISRLFSDFSWPISINFSAARQPSSEKRLRVPVSMTVDAASRSQPKEIFKIICQNRNFFWLWSHFPWLFLTLLTNFFFYWLFSDFPDLWHPWLWEKIRERSWNS